MQPEPAANPSSAQPDPRRRAPRRPLALLALLPILFGGVGGWWFFGRGSADAHHVVLIVIDTSRRDCYGCYGAARPVTPRIDAFAADAVRFDQAVAASCWTLPSVASILTATHPATHGAFGKGLDLRRLRAEIVSGVEVLRRAGYRTQALVNCAFLSAPLGLNRGFDRYNYVPSFNDWVRRADETVSEALKAARRNRRHDSFLLVHLFDPHLAYDPPAGYHSRYVGGYQGMLAKWSSEQMQLYTGDLMRGCVRPEKPEIDYLRALYDAEMAFVDNQVGRLLDGLREMGIYDRATIILVADHGEEFFDHGRFEHGHSMYDELIHVPLIIKLPARIPRARPVVEAQVRHIDLMPTVLEIAGLAPPDTFEGASLLPLLADPAAPQIGRPAFSEGTLYGVDKVSWRADGHKLIVDFADGSAELYDLRADPLERTNIASAQAETAARLRTELTALRDRLYERAASLSAPQPVNMMEAKVHALDSLKSLGYVRAEDDTEGAE